jgi:hypothetical protein
MPKGVYKHKPLSYEHRQKVSAGIKSHLPHTAFKKGEHFSRKTEFKKGMTPWNKNKKGFKGYWAGKNRPDRAGPKSNLWKGGVTPDIQQRCSTAWWKNLRKIIYKRDNWMCQMCLKKCNSNIQCHHIIPVSDGGGHQLDNLVTLCKSCHLKIHNLLKRGYQNACGFPKMYKNAGQQESYKKSS